jgi:hypothetical protein
MSIREMMAARCAAKATLIGRSRHRALGSVVFARLMITFING